MQTTNGGEGDEDEGPESGEMSELQERQRAPASAESGPREPSQTVLLAAVSDAAPNVARYIARRVQEDVPTFAGPGTGRRRRLIANASHAGIQQFLHVAGGGRSGTHQVDDFFSKMGYGEATDGHSLAPIQDALRLAARISRDELHRIVAEHGGSAATLRRLSGLLDDEMDHLHQQVARGHETARRERTQDPARAGQHTLRLLLEGASREQLTENARTAGWTVPDRVVLTTVETHGETTLPDLADLDLLRLDEGQRALLAGSASASDILLDRLAGLGQWVRVAVSWPVPPDRAGEAHGWTRRALDLVHRRVLPDQPLIRCADHYTQLWLHAEPLLRQRLAQELLQPLLAETPNSREILSETLLVWLETRDSAPNIAALLGVHPQTVRYRWKRINDLFGEALLDPEFMVQITMLLKASVPLWKAGDQSDFETFWDNTEGER